MNNEISKCLTSFPRKRESRAAGLRWLPWTPAFEDVIQFSPRKAAEKFGPITRVSGPEEQLLNTGKLMFPQAVPEEFAKSSRFSRHWLQSVDWITSSFAGVTMTTMGGSH